MLELGGETESAHREIGHLVAELGIHNLITVGAASKITAEAAVEAGLSAERVVSFDDSVEAGKYVQQKIQTGDVVLIKGSQGSRMEKIVKEIMAEPLRAGELLVRQEAQWLR
jgi:UDP-N-acetylmuramoyl-tripeptide--D-alanyl-D-alanine ligase